MEYDELEHGMMTNRSEAERLLLLRLLGLIATI